MRLKIWVSVVLAIVTGVLLGKFMLNQYNSEYELTPVFNPGTEQYYFLKQGEYDRFETMEENMMSFDYYIYEEKEGKFITYVGITKNYDNMVKIQGYFTNAGYTIYVTEVHFDNEAFSTIMDQYDLMLHETEDNQTIKGICTQVLAKYEELIINSDSSN